MCYNMLYGDLLHTAGVHRLRTFCRTKVMSSFWCWACPSRLSSSTMCSVRTRCLHLEPSWASGSHPHVWHCQSSCALIASRFHMQDLSCLADCRWHTASTTFHAIANIAIGFRSKHKPWCRLRCRWRTASITPTPSPTWPSASSAGRRAVTCPASVSRSADMTLWT